MDWIISLGLWTLKLVPCGGVHEMILPLPSGSPSQSFNSSCSLTTNKNGICTGDRPRSLLHDDVGVAVVEVADKYLLLWWLESNGSGECCIPNRIVTVIVEPLQLLLPLLLQLFAMGTEVVVPDDGRLCCTATIAAEKCESSGSRWERDMDRTLYYCRHRW